MGKKEAQAWGGPLSRAGAMSHGPLALNQSSKSGSRAQNTTKIVGVFLFFSGCFLICMEFGGVLIIPKLLILTPGHIAILFG